MTWIRLDVSFRSHWKVKRLSIALKVGLVQARGHLTTFWTGVIEVAPDGNLTSMDDAAIAATADWEGEPELFVKAMHEARLLDRTDKGYVVHDWMNFAGSFLAAQKKAKQRARKKKLERKAKSARCETGPVPGQSGDGPLRVPGMSPVTGQDRTGQDETDKSGSGRAREVGTEQAIDRTPNAIAIRPRAAPRDAGRRSSRRKTIMQSVGEDSMRDVADSKAHVTPCPPHISEQIAKLVPQGAGVKRIRSDPKDYRRRYVRGHRAVQRVIRFGQLELIRSEET